MVYNKYNKNKKRIYQDMNQYLEKLNRINTKDEYNALEEYAKINQVPIIQYESLIALLAIIKMKRVHKILEVGTAIAYSALQMASVDTNITIDTIERDEKMVQVALQNINEHHKESQIKVHFEDALLIDLQKLDTDYDLIFIDAAKAQYEKFFQRFSPLLKKDGIIVTDNILFHGCVEEMLENSPNLTKNVKNMAKKIDSYNQNLVNNPAFITYYLNIGDGLAITMRKNDDEIYF